MAGAGGGGGGWLVPPRPPASRKAHGERDRVRGRGKAWYRRR